MNFIKIAKTGVYLPELKIENQQIEERLQLEPGYIQKRTGIETRYYATKTQEYMAKKLIQNMFNQQNTKNISTDVSKDIDLIIVATTTPSQYMPGIANAIQKELNIQSCISFDILAGCSGFINALDIAHKYMKASQIKKALVVGIEQLSKFVDEKDVSTVILLSDGAGAVLLEKTDEPKVYFSNIDATIDNGEILTCKAGEKISMKGKEIYRYAVTETVKNIEKLLNDANETLENIKYIIPHQSNLKIMKSIGTRLGESAKNKIYTNINKKGNTFCASIPIALDEMFTNGLLQKGDKIILLGYGGGLNTGSILIEI